MGRKPVKRFSGMGSTRREEVEGELDSEIRDLVMDLNSQGFRTYSSCSGDTYLTGIIHFDNLSPKPTREEVDAIRATVKRHTDVPFRLFQQKGDRPMWLVFRYPLGSNWKSFRRELMSPEEPGDYLPWDTVVVLDSKGKEVPNYGGATLGEIELSEGKAKELFLDDKYWER